MMTKTSLYKDLIAGVDVMKEEQGSCINVGDVYSLIVRLVKPKRALKGMSVAKFKEVEGVTYMQCTLSKEWYPATNEYFNIHSNGTKVPDYPYRLARRSKIALNEARRRYSERNIKVTQLRIDKFNNPDKADEIDALIKQELRKTPYKRRLLWES